MTHFTWASAPGRLPWIERLVYFVGLAGCCFLASCQAPKADSSAPSTPAVSVDSNLALLANDVAVAEAAWAVAVDAETSEPDRLAALETYNAAVAELVVAIGSMPPGWMGTQPTLEMPGGGREVQLTQKSQRGSVSPRRFTRLVPASEVSKKGFDTNAVRSGAGAALVGIQDDEPPVPHRPPQGFAEPVTAVLDFKGDKAILVFLNPDQVATVRLGGRQFNLAADFTAPMAVAPRPNELLAGLVAMRFSDRAAMRRGIYFIEPYDPEKIPVLFVHGLMSSPLVWTSFVNDLNANPEFRKQFQAWVYFYPSGAPIGGNAVAFRRALAELATQFPKAKDIILVTHSMGGLVGKMQVMTTGDKLIEGIFGDKTDAVLAKMPADSIMREGLFFEANPNISRIIFIATPHLGSRLADWNLARLGSALIRLPSAVLTPFKTAVRPMLEVAGMNYGSVPTSIQGLSPENPLLLSLAKIPLEVPSHSIIGNRGQWDVPLPETSDGVVPYWSSHFPAAKSELIVPTGHDAYKCPEAVAEVLRILDLAAQGDR